MKTIRNISAVGISKTIVLVVSTFLLLSCAGSPPGTCNSECWNDDNCQSGLVCLPMAESYVCTPSACTKCTGTTTTCVMQESSSGTCSFVRCQ